METNLPSKTYLTIESIRLLDIRIILDGEQIYEGKCENIPNEIKKFKYSDIEYKDKFIFYIYSKLNIRQ